jgi:hypothetical protein
MSFTPRQFWVANGCALWLSMARMMRFVVTAYLTDKPKAGEDLWPRK